MSKISTQRAREMMQTGATLIDVREPDEFAREAIAQARNIPMSQITKLSFAQLSSPLIFHCKSGHRTSANLEKLTQAADANVFILDGGIEAWKAAGLPTFKDHKKPIELTRQVQIAAGSLVVAGAAIGALIHPMGFVLSAIVGAGLMFSGLSGTCAMASVLKSMPWNARA